MTGTLRSFARYSFCLTFAVAFAALPPPAHVVAAGGTDTLSNATNTFTGGVTVGTNGSLTLLVLSDNSLLTNSANGVISRGGTNRGNNQ